MFETVACPMDLDATFTETRLFDKVVADAMCSHHKFLYVRKEQVSCHLRNDLFF